MSGLADDVVPAPPLHPGRGAQPRRPGTDSRAGHARAVETQDSPVQVAAFYRDHASQFPPTTRLGHSERPNGRFRPIADARCPSVAPATDKGVWVPSSEAVPLRFTPPE